MLLLVSAFWGGAFAAIRYLVRYVSPADLLVLRFVPVTIMAIVWMLLVYRREAFGLMSRFWWLFVLLSAVMVFGYHLVLNIGETVLPAAAAGLIIGIYPIFTVFLASPFLKEKLTPAKVAGGLIAFAGTAFLVIYGAGEEGAMLDIEPMQWVQYSILTLLAPISAAVHTMIARPYLTGKNRTGARIDPIVLTLGYMAPAGFLAMVLYRPGLTADIATAPPGFWGALIFLVLFCTIFAYMGWFWALARVEAGPSAIFTFIIPLFSLAYARIWLDEPIGVPIMVGAAGIVVGVVIASLGSWESGSSGAHAPAGGGGE